MSLALSKLFIEVFPAWAGVSPLLSTIQSKIAGFPRVGGGEPVAAVAAATARKFSPRGRG